MILDDETISRFLFHPRPDPEWLAPAGRPTATWCRGATVGGCLHESRRTDTVLLFFHGNGETAADYDELAGLFTGCGVSFWAADYRGYGRSTGAPTYSAILEDAEALLADVPRLAADVGRTFSQIVVMGRSLGSACAIHLGARHAPDLAGLVLDSPYADAPALIERLGGPSLGRLNRADFTDNLDKIRDCRLPTLIVHGTADGIIPVAEAEALFAAGPSEAKKLLKVEGAGHNNLFAVGYDAYSRGLREFLARATGSRAAREWGHAIHPQGRRLAGPRTGPETVLRKTLCISQVFVYGAARWSRHACNAAASVPYSGKGGLSAAPGAHSISSVVRRFYRSMRYRPPDARPDKEVWDDYRSHERRNANPRRSMPFAGA